MAIGISLTSTRGRPDAGLRRPTYARIEMTAVKIVTLALLSLYSGVGLFLGLLLAGVWIGGTLALGSLLVGLGALRSWKRPGPGGALIVIGGIVAGGSLGSFGAAFSSGVSLAAGFLVGAVFFGGIPILAGLSFVGVSCWHRRHPGRPS